MPAGRICWPEKCGTSQGATRPSGVDASELASRQDHKRSDSCALGSLLQVRPRLRSKSGLIYPGGSNYNGRTWAVRSESHDRPEDRTEEHLPRCLP